MTPRKQLSMVLPAALIAAIKHRAAARGQSITAYITALVQQDLSSVEALPPPHGGAHLAERVHHLEQRVMKLEKQAL